MKQLLQAKYQEMVAAGQVAPRGNGNGRQNRNGFRRQNNNQYGQQQQQNFYPQQQQMMQQQPVQYVTAGQQPMMAMPQQQVATTYYHVPQPQNVQMVPQGQAMNNNNMKVGAVLGNNGTQAVPENAVMNVMTAVPQQAQQVQMNTTSAQGSPSMAYTYEAPVNM